MQLWAFAAQFPFASDNTRTYADTGESKRTRLSCEYAASKVRRAYNCTIRFVDGNGHQNKTGLQINTKNYLWNRAWFMINYRMKRYPKLLDSVLIGDMTPNVTRNLLLNVAWRITSLVTWRVTSRLARD